MAGLAADQSPDITSIKAEAFAKISVLCAELFRKQLPQSLIFMLELKQILHFLTGSCDRRDSLLCGFDNFSTAPLALRPPRRADSFVSAATLLLPLFARAFLTVGASIEASEVAISDAAFLERGPRFLGSGVFGRAVGDGRLSRRE